MIHGKLLPVSLPTGFDTIFLNNDQNIDDYMLNKTLKDLLSFTYRHQGIELLVTSGIMGFIRNTQTNSTLGHHDQKSYETIAENSAITNV